MSRKKSRSQRAGDPVGLGWGSPVLTGNDDDEMSDLDWLEILMPFLEGW